MNHKQTHKRKLRHNIKPGIFLLLLPVAIGAVSLSFIFSSAYGQYLSASGAKRLAANNWSEAATEMVASQPTYERKYAYYQLRENQDLQKVSDFFSVPTEKLATLNPGKFVAGATIKLTPPEHPLTETAGPNGKIVNARVTVEEGLIRVNNDYKFDLAVTNIPELMELLRPYGAIEKTGDKTYRINKPISLEDNIRLDVTSKTVTKLELRSAPDDVVCLCMDGSAALIKDVVISSYDPATQKPDTKHSDRRSFLRNKSGRMDILNSTLSYLGNGLIKYANEADKPMLQKEGGTYGISWRIPDDKLGVDVTTGWVEGNLFYRNHFGSYTYGASGMSWLNNHYLENDVYGLDPHDDSNNALIENNVFERNGKHGFIVSKRCNYNIIRNNTSFGNKLHGYMLHQDSAYNLMENNVAYDNVDNFAIYASDFNTVRGNKSYNAKSSHIRINELSRNTFVTDNQLEGGQRGIHLYGNVNAVLIRDNSIKGVRQIMNTTQAQHVLFAQNVIDSLSFSITSGDQVLFGENIINRDPVALPQNPALPSGFTPKAIQF